MANTNNVSDLIQFDSSGVKIATFTQIRSVLIQRFKDVYGTDIDLSTASVDGIYVNDLALIINNILQTIQTMYSNLNINTARGVYLETLCALSNVKRKQQYKSQASLVIKSTMSTESVSQELALFVDDSGITWQANSDIPSMQADTDQVVISVTCTEYGPIAAPAGWITKLVDTDLNSNFIISQPTAATLGGYEETDSALRSRRAQSNGAHGTTVLESLTNALLNIDSIRDVKIYNNNTSSNITTKDGVTVLSHNVYIICRELIDSGSGTKLTELKALIGQTIYNLMTPGISTTEPTVQSRQYSGGSGKVNNASYTVYWKHATTVNPTITVKLEPIDRISTASLIALIVDSSVKSSMLSYLNTLPIGQDLSVNDVISQLVYSDPLTEGRQSYQISDVKINNATTTYTNPDAYYNYTTCSYNTSTKTLTIS